MTARETLKSLAEVARHDQHEAEGLAKDFRARADALENIVVNHTDEVCAKLLERIKKEAPSVLPS